MRCARCVLALSASKWIGRERLAAACCPVPWVSCLFLPSTAELCLLLWVGSNPKITIASQIAAVSPGCWGWPFKQRYHTSSAPSQASHPRDSENYSSTIYQLHRKSNLRSGAGICPSFCDVLPFGGKKKNSLAPPQLPSSSWTSWSGSSAQWSWGFSAGAHDREVSGLPKGSAYSCIWTTSASLRDCYQGKWPRLQKTAIFTYYSTKGYEENSTAERGGEFSKCVRKPS